MLRRPTSATRRRVAAHACPRCRRLWALSGSRIPSGSWVIACKFCGWHAIRGGRPAAGPGPRHAPASHWSHGVLFYSDDHGLVDALVEHLATAWDAGGVGLVIASPEHRAALRERLAADGRLDPLADGAFVELDAAETLARLMDDDGVPDAERFDRTVGSLVRVHAAHGLLRGFGEMVDLLWAAGDAVGALELERLWSGLQDEVPFSLLCAYSTARLGEGDRAVLGRAHDHVTA